MSVVDQRTTEDVEVVRGFIWSSHDVRQHMQEALETLRLAQGDAAAEDRA